MKLKNVFVKFFIPTIIISLSNCTLRASQDTSYFIIPFDMDPPIEIDGSLDDWAGIPNVIIMNVTWGTKNWTGPNDLSATAHVAYRNEGLYIAAEVTDDIVLQPYGGVDIYKGDHVEFYLDLTPNQDTDRLAFGAGQFVFGLSPGNFGTAENIISPQIYTWCPTNAPMKNVQIAAKKTDKGYIIEAYVPFESLGAPNIRMNQDANFELIISDSDSQPVDQQTIMTIGTNKWNRYRGRLLPVVFGDGNGKGTPPVRSVKIMQKGVAAESKTLAVDFNLPIIPEDKEPHLFFQARIHREKPSGFQNKALSVEINGKRIKGNCISNRPQRSLWMSGEENVFINDDGQLTIPYTPSGDAYDRNSHYKLIDGIKACEFEFNVAGLLKGGEENTLVFNSLIPQAAEVNNAILIENVELRLTAKKEPAIFKPAPSGPLSVFEPQHSFPKTYSGLVQKQGKLDFNIDNEKFSVESQFTAPDGNWHSGSTPFYEHTRKVIEHNEWIEIQDTFKNLTKENIPIIQKHYCSLGERAKNIWLSCVQSPSASGSTSEAENPSVFAVTKTSGIGMLALNDEFRVHSVESCANGTIYLSDNEFVLKANSTYTAEWCIVPVKKPDMWAFVNAARRLLDANFTLKYMFAFMTHGDPVWDWSDKMFKNFIDYKNANFVTQSHFAKYNGYFPHGLAFNKLSQHYNYFTDFHKRLKRLFPGNSVKHAIYYHCFLDIMSENAELYKDCRQIDASGNHATYGDPVMKIYIPTLENDWGKEIGKGIDLRLDEIGTDAFYWDEYNQSKGKYTYNMQDGYSADIDPQTFKITRLKGAVHLISLNFLHYHIKRILDREVPFIGNGAPMSRTLAKLKFQNFVETGNMDNYHKTLLHSPIVLGDHLTERSEKDAYNVMLRALEAGCLYNWYNDIVIPTHKTITEHMLPFTPIELHSGYVIGKERIITKCSGLFGWGDDRDFKAFVYDREGKAANGKEVKKVFRDGKNYAEVRIPEGYSAAIVRD